jgi:triosephosphate isomerase
MGVLSFHVTKYGKNRGSGAATVQSSDYRVSGAFTTSTTAANLTDSAAATVQLGPGELLSVFADEAMRIRIGGAAATATNGIFIPASIPIDIECDNPGTVSVIDVA